MSRFLLAVVVVACSGCLVREVRDVGLAQPPVTLETLEDDLAGQGAWLELPVLGRVWQPAEAFAGSDFYPYGTGGRWVLTEVGWIFDSPHPFGWATFHYGRWSLEPAFGWVWQPGTAWAPAWVAWRTGPRAIGWAPLAPEGVPPLVAARWSFIEPGQLGSGDPRLGALTVGQFDEAALQTRPARGEAARRGPTSAQLGAGLAPSPRALASFASASRPTGTAAWHRDTKAEVRVTRERPVPPRRSIPVEPGAGSPADRQRSPSRPTELAPVVAASPRASELSPVAWADHLPVVLDPPSRDRLPSVPVQRSPDRLKVR